MTLEEFEKYYESIKGTENINEYAKYLNEYGDNFFGEAPVDFEYFENQDGRDFFIVFDKKYDFDEFEKEFLEYLKSKDIVPETVYIEDEEVILYDIFFKIEFERYIEVTFIENKIENIQKNFWVSEEIEDEFEKEHKEGETFEEFKKRFFIFETASVHGDIVEIAIYEDSYDIKLVYSHEDNLYEFDSDDRKVVFDILERIK